MRTTVPATSAAVRESSVETLAIPMSDGVSLAALRVPASRSPAPAVVVLTPYGKEGFSDQLMRFGLGSPSWDVIVADVRGIGGSGGDWDGPMSPREISDGVETLAWVAAQDFSDGRTALFGASYSGLNTLLIAARRPSSLRCAAVVVPPVDHYRDMWRRGGIPSHVSWGINVGFANEHRPAAMERILRDFYLETITGPLDSERHRSRSVEGRFDEIDVPVLVMSGWYDHLLRGAIRAFEGLTTPKRLVIGNWGHRIDEARATNESARWLAHWLNGEGPDPTAAPNVLLQCVGSGAWTSNARWPVAAELAFERWRPIAAATPIEVGIAETPSTTGSPVPLAEDMRNSSGMHLWGETWTATAPKARAATRYQGPVALKLVLVSATARDIDVHARLSIVRADGTVHQVTEGRLRASHRCVDVARSQLTSGGEIATPWHPHDVVEPIPLGDPITLDVEVGPISLELGEGGSLRLGLMLLRAEAMVGPAVATLLPDTHVLLPRTDR